MSLELRREGQTAVISGLASRFGSWYEVRMTRDYAFRETVRSGAFTDSLRGDPHVIFTAEHDRSRAVARTPRTLSIWESGEGLSYRATVDLADPDSRALVSKIEAGVLSESSFAFRVPEHGDSWNQDKSERTIIRADLHRGDVSAVVYGSNPDTNVAVERGATTPLERRALASLVSRAGVGGYVDLRSLLDPDGDGDVEDDDQDEVPPNLRGALTAARSCSTCRWFGDQVCTRFDDYPVTGAQVCDAWQAQGDVGEPGEPLTMPRSAAAQLRAGPQLLGGVLAHLRRAQRAVEDLRDPGARIAVDAAMEDALRLDRHLRAHPSDPAVHAAERRRLDALAARRELTDDLARERVALESAAWLARVQASEDREEEARRDYSAKERAQMAAHGMAMPDGSFPIKDRIDLSAAIRLAGRAKDPSAARRHIVKRAKALGLAAMIPESWGA